MSEMTADALMANLQDAHARLLVARAYVQEWLCDQSIPLRDRWAVYRSTTLLGTAPYLVDNFGRWPKIEYFSYARRGDLICLADMVDDAPEADSDGAEYMGDDQVTKLKEAILAAGVSYMVWDW